MHLTVINPFGSYNRGDKITDEDEVAEILESENARDVVKTADNS